MAKALEGDWLRSYRDLMADIPNIVRHASVTLCGMSACVDARISMHDLKPLFDATEPKEAVAFGELLKYRAARSIGGEVRVEWPEGPSWLAEHLPIRYALGGTGPQAGWTLTAIGAPALVALEDRSAHMLAQLHADLLLAENGQCVPAREVTPRGMRRPEIFIFEYTADRPVGDVIPARSSRIIVRFHDPGLEHDPQFDALSIKLAPSAGAGLISGFNSVPRHKFDSEIDRICALTKAWRDAGLTVIHLELAGYDTPEARDTVLDRVRGSITSIGMSHSEFAALNPRGSSLADGMCDLGRHLGIDRVCVHADQWAVSATLGDPEQEHVALAMGCLLAGTRAARGLPAQPHKIHEQATFTAPPVEQVRMRGNWSLVSCPSPYLEHPAATVGLGDSFTGGCLLMLGQRSPHTGRMPVTEPARISTIPLKRARTSQ